MFICFTFLSFYVILFSADLAKKKKRGEKNMKNAKTLKFFALALAVLMIFACMAGCGKSEIGNTKNEEKTIDINSKDFLVGEWSGTIKLGETNDGMEGTSLADLDLEMIMTFDDDGEVVLETHIDKSDLKDAFEDYFKEEFGKQGVEYSEDLIEQAMGKSLDEFVDETIKEVNREETQYYKYEKKNLYTREDEDDDWEKEENFSVLSENKIKLKMDDVTLKMTREE